MRKAVLAAAAIMTVGSTASFGQSAEDKNYCAFHGKGQTLDLNDPKSFSFVVPQSQGREDRMQNAVMQLDGSTYKVTLVAKVEDQSNPDKRTGSYTYNTADRDSSVIGLDIEQGGMEGGAIAYAGKLTVAQKGKIRTFDIAGSCAP